MRTLYKILGLSIFDIVLLWLWVYYMNPDPSVSIESILLVPVVFVLNLIIAGVLFFARKKDYARIFLINSFIASIVMFYLFEKGIDRFQNKRLESWTFQKADTTFSLIRWKKTSEFSMSYNINPGSSLVFLNGYCTYENGKYKLKADSIRMEIDKDNLIGFRNLIDTIKMKKVER